MKQRGGGVPGRRGRDALATAARTAALRSDMQKVPKIVGERLKAGAVAVDHPDPDLLTAFSEHALREPERKQVLEHLARCGECRDVLALSLPVEEPSVAVIRPVRGRWLIWPRLRWGLVAAGVIVVGSFGVLRYRESSSPAMVASYDAPRAQGIANEAKTQAEPSPAPPKAAQVEEEKKTPQVELFYDQTKSKPAPETDKEFDRLEQFAKLQPPVRDQRLDAGRAATGMLRTQSLPHGPKPPAQQWQLNVNGNANNNAYASQSQTPAPAVPPEFARSQSSNQVVVSAQAPAPSAAGSVIGGPVTDKKVQDLDTLAVNRRPLTALQPGVSSAGAEVARAKPAATPAVNAPKADAADAYSISTANGSNFAQTSPLVLESARWSINATGGLQRSLDQGKSWQDVDVTGAAGIAGGVNLRMAMKASREKALAKDKADMKQAPVIFRAVSANGPDVWAGGSRGHLYHSTDAGEHWVQVVPSWSGVELTSDIVSLQFADPLQGRIVTSSSEIWTTADAGQTWQKR